MLGAAVIGGLVARFLPIGQSGAPARTAAARVASLSPAISSVSGDGPTKVMPTSAQRRDSSGRSLRKP